MSRVHMFRGLGFTCSEVSGSHVQRSRVHMFIGLGFTCSEVSGSYVQRSRVHIFRGLGFTCSEVSGSNTVIDSILSSSRESISLSGVVRSCGISSSPSHANNTLYDNRWLQCIQIHPVRKINEKQSCVNKILYN